MDKIRRLELIRRVRFSHGFSDIVRHSGKMKNIPPNSFFCSVSYLILSSLILSYLILSYLLLSYLISVHPSIHPFIHPSIHVSL